ncbi:urease accessory protein UreD [Roseovarius indicus]|uniref:urease accessory protein UreD n=1 Tax=Roseovarius indicus TaxID=540747 RepID=UPI001F1D6B83|nr:urease accessory protein UreD [Roseovarius indicus]
MIRSKRTPRKISGGRTVITLHPAHVLPPVLPRARGEIALSTKPVAGRSVLDTLRQSGAYKALFPRPEHSLQAILINTSGGVTGGDRFHVTAHIGADTHTTLTTQAAERAYRASPGETGHMRTRLTVADNATLHWLPQELILYNGCALDRRLEIDLAPTARLLMVEPVLFGRTAMGETLTDATFRDRISITRQGQPLYLDGVSLTGDLAARLARASSGKGAAAMVSLLYVAPDAEAHLAPLRALLPATGGASLLAPDMLTLRLVAPDGHALRTHLLPALDRLSGGALPTSWRL